MKFAILGAGRIAQVHARTFASMPEHSIEIVPDPFGDAAEKLATQYSARATRVPPRKNMQRPPATSSRT
ncbi:hypothetical protein HMPREF9306_01906 [Propionimicrobium lymphophilum ACS-093-V-SCH5]|uniref:Gfo/Idh/MocA-like oxidoreductase N-terminal domain-containing protein n=1 Tax=Propionimicrobium lymphophilum ACS-093-V-SCH5 TaxID=883161 RepID=S2WI95_9ACTN|nr:hypothetical protein [Propionimicrobium lymphophilum]EPD32337.1 hypothetical protein HMPREF9306_01906 [Propionimicrobium lymphophilum ACS-093-V-SCH5]